MTNYFPGLNWKCIKMLKLSTTGHLGHNIHNVQINWDYIAKCVYSTQMFIKVLNCSQRKFCSCIPR